MIIGHFSDIHGKLALIDAGGPVDLWVSSGDFLPDPPWVVGTAGDVEKYQRKWLAAHAADIAKRLNGHPLLYVGGNHDFIDIGIALQRAGAQATDLSLLPAHVGGYVFAGFREVMPINGWCRGETLDFTAVIDRAFGANPTILVTHAPPFGVLDAYYGIPALEEAFRRREHRIRAHLFGHIHEHGGQSEVRGSVVHYNAATTCVRVHI